MVSQLTNFKAGALAISLGAVTGRTPEVVETSNGLKLIWKQEDIPAVRAKLDEMIDSKEVTGDKISLEYLPVVAPRLIRDTLPFIAGVFFAGIIIDKAFLSDH